MAGFIVLDDGRAFAPSSEVLDASIEAITAELDLAGSGSAAELAGWLRGRLLDSGGPELGEFDVRELTAENRELFRQAAERACQRARAAAVSGTTKAQRAWLSEFGRLMRMWRSIDRGQPPEALGDLGTALPASGTRSGPGWDRY